MLAPLLVRLREPCGAGGGAKTHFNFKVRPTFPCEHRDSPVAPEDAFPILNSIMAPQPKMDRTFGALTPSLSEWILEAVDSMGFVKTTPVQHAAIPMFMKNSDVVVEAVTGSGKTLAYENISINYTIPLTHVQLPYTHR